MILADKHHARKNVTYRKSCGYKFLVTLVVAGKHTQLRSWPRLGKYSIRLEAACSLRNQFCSQRSMGNSMLHVVLHVFAEYQLHKKHSNVVAQEEIIII